MSEVIVSRLKAILERLSPIGPPLFGVAVLCFAFVAWVYPAFHKRGHYGTLEVVKAAATIVLLLAILGLFAWLALGVWQLLAQKQREWPPKYYIPAVVIVAFFTFKYSTAILQGSAVNVWAVTPFGLPYSETLDRYDDQCTVEVRDDENSSHREDDWHAGDAVCGALSRRLYRLFPGPSWLFGSRAIWKIPRD